MKKMVKIMAISLITLLLNANLFSALPVYAEGEIKYSSSREKIYTKATLEDDFTDNEIIIIVYSDFNNKKYSVVDFADIKCIAVEELIEGKETYDPSRILLLTIEGHSKDNVLEATKKLSEREDIYCAEPNFYSNNHIDIVEEFDANFLIPNNDIMTSDEKYNEQWGLEKISISNAWNISTGSPSICVGVIDSGINNKHPDLKNRVSTTLSRSFINSFEGNPFDDIEDHGTKVAGVIGAEADNKIGISGVCKNVTLVSLRYFYERGDIYNDTSASFVAAIKYAEQNNIRIVNYSYSSSDKSEARKNAAENFNGLIVCAAGNNNSDLDGNDINYYPHEYGFPNVITVGASNINDSRWTTSNINKGSNFGKKTVDLFAPGENIYTTSADGGYVKASGTSMAAPFVSGVAALLLAKDPTLSPCEIKATIMDNVDKVSALSDLCVSGGRLNAEKALKNIQKHTWTYTPITVAKGHKKTCAECGYEEVGAHKWIKIYAEKPYVCTFCGISTSIVPSNFISISDILEENEGEVLICPITDLADYIEKYLGSIRNT